MSENEEWYDREIAPKLRKLCEACMKRGLSFAAQVEYEPGSRARTEWLAPNAGLEMVMIRHCAATAPNIDGYVIGLIRYCREKGIPTDASIVARQFSKNGEANP